MQAQDHGLDQALDHILIEKAAPALESKTPVIGSFAIRNVHRTVGAMLGGEIARRYGSAGLPEGTIHFRFHGSAGQSFGAFVPNGVTLELEGDSNDYLGKGLSGGRLVAYPPKTSSFLPEESILVGNVVLYGATAGEAFLNGIAGERFAVRNSGATAVVEGVGDHGCEYMTNGLVVVLGSTGRNFAAGMSGGIAYVYDEAGRLLHAPLQPAPASTWSPWFRPRTWISCAACWSVIATSPAAPARPGSWSTGPARSPDSSRSSRTSTSASWASRAPDRPPMRPTFLPQLRRPLWRPRQRYSMGKVTGFLEIQREQPPRRKPEDRLHDWFEIYQPFPEQKQREQSARCMDCGVPFCHTGCPVNNLIPDWNDLAYNGRWQAAIRRLHATNNFPEFTGRICPAPCEAACVLGINQPPVSIKLIEKSIVERAWEEGWIQPEPPEQATGKRVAVVGSGPFRPGRRAAVAPLRPLRHRL